MRFGNNVERDICVQGAAEKSSPLKFFVVFSATVNSILI